MSKGLWNTKFTLFPSVMKPSFTFIGNKHTRDVYCSLISRFTDTLIVHIYVLYMCVTLFILTCQELCSEVLVDNQVTKQGQYLALPVYISPSGRM